MFFSLIQYFSCFSQDIYSISSNSRYFAKCNTSYREVNKKKYWEHKIQIYDTGNKHEIAIVSFNSEIFNRVDSMVISPDARAIIVITENTCHYLNTLTGEVFYEFSVSKTDLKKKIFKIDKNFCFSNFDNQFYLLIGNEIRAYSTLSGDKVFEYSNANISNIVTSFQTTFDDKYIVVKDSRNKQYIWETGIAKIKKKINADELAYNEAENSFYALKRSPSSAQIYCYSLPKFTRTNKIDCQKTIKEILSSENFNTENPVAFLVSISPGGGYYIITAIINKYEYRFYIVKTSTDKIVSALTFPQYDNTLNPFVWQSDSIIIFNDSYSISTIFHIPENRIIAKTDLLLHDIERKVSENKQIKDRVLSPNFQYTAVPFNNLFNYGLFLKSNLIAQQSSSAPKVSFRQFSENSKYVLVYSKNKGYGIIDTEDIEADMGEKDMAVSYFSDSIITEIEPVEATDAGTPYGFKYNRIRSLKNISAVTDSSLINIDLKTVLFNHQDSTVKIQFHLIDENGAFLTGAASEEMKTIWCDLILKLPDNNINQLQSFEVSETIEADSVPVATALILDHSGSMGEERARKLQTGAKNIISKKYPNDALSVLKYDDRIDIEAALDKSKDKLLNNLKIIGMMGYGGATSLIDAINMGITSLKMAKDFEKKAIIIMTDGGENSSRMRKNEVIAHAVSNNIAVYTIGFGDYISEGYLKSISDYTGGSFYRIYKTSDLSWIFEDIYKKVKNYYTISFKYSKVGNYTAFLKICPPAGKSDTMNVSFNNENISIKKIKELPDNAVISFINQNNKNSDTIVSGFTPLSDFSNIKINSSIKKIQESEPKNDNIHEIQAEFNKIVFPDIKFYFDKTIVIEGSDEGLEDVAEFLQKYPHINILITGHTDDKGSENYNLDLSKRRAEKIKQLLIDMGIDEKRIVTKGEGELKPVDSNSNDLGRQINRRVEFKIIND